MSIVYIYDRLYHPSMQAAWAAGRVAVAPIDADPVEWRASALRLKKQLGTTVRCGFRRGRVEAIANGGIPLGITDPTERDAWLRKRSDVH